MCCWHKVAGTYNSPDHLYSARRARRLPADRAVSWAVAPGSHPAGGSASPSMWGALFTPSCSRLPLHKMFRSSFACGINNVSSEFVAMCRVLLITKAQHSPANSLAPLATRQELKQLILTRMQTTSNPTYFVETLMYNCNIYVMQIRRLCVSR